MPRNCEALFECKECADSVSTLRILRKRPGDRVIFWMPESAIFCPWCKAPITKVEVPSGVGAA